jgi:hypothetical protein
LTYRYVFQVITLPVWSSLGVPAVASGVTLAGYLLGVRLLDPAHWPLTVAVLAKLLYATSAYIGVLFVLQPRATRDRTAYVFRLA